MPEALRGRWGATGLGGERGQVQQEAGGLSGGAGGRSGRALGGRRWSQGTSTTRALN